VQADQRVILILSIVRRKGRVKMHAKVTKKIVEECIRELKVHGLVKDGSDVGTYDITEKAECFIIEAMRRMRKNYPEASVQDVKFRALIFVVLQQMEPVVRKYVPVYVGILNGLTDHIVER